jgi:hypothetical protein
MAWPLFAAAGMGLAGSLIGAGESSKARREQNRLLQQALAEYAGIDIPTIGDQSLNLETLSQVGEYNPLLESIISQGPSAYEGISTDPRLAQAQMDALAQISGVAAAGGLTDADKAALELARRNAAGTAQAQISSSLQREQQMGREGAMGRELAARLMAGQSAADRQSVEGMQEQQIALQRQLAASQAAGQLGGQIRGQEFGEQAEIASARDAIQKFNAQNSQAVQGRNVGTQNTAQQQNLGERQRISDTNVGTRNQQQAYNKNLLQQQFDNQLGLAGAKANALTGQANMAGQHGAQRAGQIGETMQGLGTMVAGYYGNKPTTTAPPTVNNYYAGQEDDDIYKRRG